MNTTHGPRTGYEVRFGSLFNEGRGFAFPCDAQGCVDIDRLTERARCNYYFARSLIGRDFAAPSVRRVADHDSRSLC